MEKMNQMITECNHCGNKTRVDILSTEIHNEVALTWSHSMGEEVEEFIYSNTWHFCKCPICNNVILLEIYFEPSMIMPNGDYYKNEQTLYPINTYKGYGVPDKVNKAFEAALKARFLDSSICLLSLRRTLEIICKDREEIKRSLEAKLKNLSAKGIIPSILNQMSHIIRVFGNEAAHGDDVIHTSNEVDDMLEFTEHIINYVYVLPYKLNRIEKRLESK